MEVLVLVVSADKKPVSSTRGMQSTVETSSLMDHRINVVVPQRMREMEAAIASRDFQQFGRITMQVILVQGFIQRGEERGQFYLFTHPEFLEVIVVLAKVEFY